MRSSRSFPVPFRRYFPAQPLSWRVPVRTLLRACTRAGARYILFPSFGPERLVLVFSCPAEAARFTGSRRPFTRVQFARRGAVIVIPLHPEVHHG